MKKVVGLLALLFISGTSILAQFNSDPCNKGDTLEKQLLLPHDYNQNGWYEHLDEYYLYGDNLSDLQVDDSAVYKEYPELNMKVYTAYYEGEMFNGLTFIRTTDKGWKQFLLQIEHQPIYDYDSPKIKLFRPDSIAHPELIEVVYSQGFGSAWGSYEEQRHEIWDVLAFAKLAAFSTFFYESAREEPPDNSWTKMTHYRMSRESSFDGKRLVLGEVEKETSSYFQSNLEGEEGKDVEETNNSTCPEVSYELRNGFFVRLYDE